MTKLDRIQTETDIMLRAIGVPNSKMASIGRSKNYKLMVREFDVAIKKQIEAVMNDELFHNIHSKISKNDDIFTESDEIEIQESVHEEVRKHPLSDFISDALVTGYLIWVFEKGGQAFLDKHNLPKTFSLKNKTVAQDIENKTQYLFKGLDDTTSKWIGDQVVSGKKTGVSNSDIVDAITEKLPTYPAYRAETIVRTESAQMVGNSEHITAVKNGASHKYWLTANDARVSDECMANQAQGSIGVNQRFTSGAMVEPQHPNCRCVVNYEFTPFMGTIWAGE